MSISKYIEDARVIKEINDVKKYLKDNPLSVSDLRDNEDNQYVDLVQEGGGVLGIALLGYTYALEEIGVRFFSLGGTSAGAINTAFLAAVGKPNEKKSVKILEVLDTTNLMDFIDGGRDAEKLVEALSEERNLLHLLFTSIRQLDDFLIRKEMGINRGKSFFNWLVTKFKDFGVESTQDLIDNINSFPPEIFDRASLKDMKEEDINQLKKAKLSIIASDLTTQTKADLPSMGDLYYYEPYKINPAHYVRASMAIPVFFDPLIVNALPKGKAQVEKWQDIDKAYYFGNIPEKIVFVDGGIMSNFPIDIFHVSERTPVRPTFGVKLGIDRESENNNDSLARIIWNSFSAARQMRDHDVILKNQDYINLIANINDKDINWLNFNLPDADKVELFKRGVIAACKYIRDFDWEKYKGLRKRILEVKEKHNSNIAIQKYRENFIRSSPKT